MTIRIALRIAGMKTFIWSAKAGLSSSSVMPIWA